MAGFTLPPIPKVGAPPALVDWASGMHRTMQEALDYFNAYSMSERPLSVVCPNRLLLGSPAAAPTHGTILGTLQGDFEYAFSYGSTENDGETALSAASLATGPVIAVTVQVTGARSTDPRMDLVNIYRRDTGAGDDAWLLVASIANPPAGAWTYDDEAETSSLSVQSNLFAWSLFTACGPRFRFRRGKVTWSRDYAASASAYWRFWLAIRRPWYPQWEFLTPAWDTTQQGLFSAFPSMMYDYKEGVGYPLPAIDFEIPENGSVILMARGVGAVAPLPTATVTMSVIRPEG